MKTNKITSIKNRINNKIWNIIFRKLRIDISMKIDGEMPTRDIELKINEIAREEIVRAFTFEKINIYKNNGKTLATQSIYYRGFLK